MSSGFVNVIKPAGITSSDVVVKVRKCFPKGTRVGHMGTLDPAAMGVLPIGVGKAARLFDYVIDKDKEYIVEMALGVTTDTQDGEGQVLLRRDVHVTNSALCLVAKEFVGEIQQIPPAYSAVKKEGKRLYELAREGITVEVPARTARIDSIEVLHFATNRALLRVVCGRGTYIRTLLHDMGEKLGCGAHMAYLVRSRTGPFTMQSGITLEQMKECIAQEKSFLLPMDTAIQHLPSLSLFGQNDAMCVRNGTPLTAQRMPNLLEGDVCRVYFDTIFAGMMRREAQLLRWSAMLYEEQT